jgi:hypothetical protein
VLNRGLAFLKELSTMSNVRRFAGTYSMLALCACTRTTRTNQVQPTELQEAYPVLATSTTLADPKAFAALQAPGTVFFVDDFESSASFDNYFEIRGKDAGRAVLSTDAALAHTGRGALQLTAPANDGKSSGAGASGWFGPDGRERVYLRYYQKFAADYDQGDLNHTGAHLVGAAGDNKWAGMGTAGLLPKGDDHFSTSLESWKDWGRVPAPGFAHLYSYWMDMRIDRDGHYWGNMLEPGEGARIVFERDRWYCLEIMIQTNKVGSSDGELAAWIDGKLYLHYKNFRWRSSDAVKLKRFGLDLYVHHAAKDNTAWYDDVALSTGYVGPIR